MYNNPNSYLNFTFNKDRMTSVNIPLIAGRACWLYLIPKRNPWINMDGAATEQIIEQVKKCPNFIKL